MKLLCSTSIAEKELSAANYIGSRNFTSESSKVA